MGVRVEGQRLAYETDIHTQLDYRETGFTCKVMTAGKMGGSHQIKMIQTNLQTT